MNARGLSRRALLAGTAASLAACGAREVEGGFAGAAHERGHLLRAAPSGAASPALRRTRVVIAGAGIAGLAAARALRLRGIDDFTVLDLEDTPGGNSRGGQLGGLRCPLGAHYLPVPGDAAPHVQDLLEELGLRRRIAGRWAYDERHLCHSPQERLFFQGHWQEGLLPVQGVGEPTLAQYRRFAAAVEPLRRSGTFAMPMARRTPTGEQLALDRITLAEWLAHNGLDDAHLRWYLDYCCRDDYGAGVQTVSAWAGLHYFAARHGFHAPGEREAEREAVLTWPEGNGWLAEALAKPLGERFIGARVVSRIAVPRQGVEVDAVDARTGAAERWHAAHCIVALPVFVAARVVEDAPDFLRARAAALRHAPWLVANLHLREPLDGPREGMPQAWDNVVHGAASLGYVVATHQSLDPRPGPTVLTWYLAPGQAARSALLRQPWTHWRDQALAELAPVHADLPDKLTRVAVTRYGHAMAVPAPGVLALPRPPSGRLPRLSFAHADWAGYSVFEEAFTLGHLAGLAI